MLTRKLLFLVVIACFFSCQVDTNSDLSINLQEYIDVNSNNSVGEVIACAASEEQNTAVSYIFYYPLVEATDIRYYEADITVVDSNDFSKYTRKRLPIEPVFGGKLERFVRSDTEEAWCIVTFMLQGTLHKSNPIRLKNISKPTEWLSNVSIDFSQSGTPKFSWNDGSIAENAIYFQVISNVQETFLSGTYTFDKWYQYKNTNNVVLTINTETPPDLILNEDYLFTMMGVSEDNWVNLIIQKRFTAQ